MLDGVGDLPHPDLAGKTPLEAATTKNMDMLAKNGIMGQVISVGKGAPEYWACRVKPGRIIFEVDGIDEPTARVALYKASTKLPVKTKFVKRF